MPGLGDTPNSKDSRKAGGDHVYENVEYQSQHFRTPERVPFPNPYRPGQSMMGDTESECDRGQAADSEGTRGRVCSSKNAEKVQKESPMWVLGEAVLMMELPKRQAASLEGRPARTRLCRYVAAAGLRRRPH